MWHIQSHSNGYTNYSELATLYDLQPQAHKYWITTSFSVPKIAESRLQPRECAHRNLSSSFETIPNWLLQSLPRSFRLGRWKIWHLYSILPIPREHHSIMNRKPQPWRACMHMALIAMKNWHITCTKQAPIEKTIVHRICAPRWFTSPHSLRSISCGEHRRCAGVKNRLNGKRNGLVPVFIKTFPLQFLPAQRPFLNGISWSSIPFLWLVAVPPDLFNFLVSQAIQTRSRFSKVFANGFQMYSVQNPFLAF